MLFGCLGFRSGGWRGWPSPGFAELSHRRKSDPYRSAMSMLTFYINRAGKNLPAARKKTLEAAKGELRKAFGKAA